MDKQQRIEEVGKYIEKYYIPGYDDIVVDDEEVAAEHARIILDEAGIKADTCYDGQTALKMLEVQHAKHEPYNLVLLDWKMPEMDGVEVARKIREQYDDMRVKSPSQNWLQALENFI